MPVAYHDVAPRMEGDHIAILGLLKMHYGANKPSLAGYGVQKTSQRQNLHMKSHHLIGHTFGP